jgi:hypothetical protein
MGGKQAAKKKMLSENIERSASRPVKYFSPRRLENLPSVEIVFMCCA